MHLPLSTWLAASALIPTITAFYPYEPNYSDGSNSNGKVRRGPSPNLPSRHYVDIENKGSITLPLRRVPLLTRDNKYNIVNSADPKQENSVAIDQDGTDLSYMVAVTIGSSKEEYHLLLDSAASNTWVMGEECTTDACKSHNTFGEGDSDTLKTSDTTFSITYGTGSVSGTTATDTLHISSLSPLLTFGLATNVSSEFSSYPMDGILGIGRGDNVPGTIEAPQLVEVLSSSDLIGAKLYGIHLSRASDGTNDGELNFGEVNKERFDGDLNWSDAVNNDNGFWEIAIADAGADGKMLGITDRTAILDTGTSFILMPEADAVSLHSLVDGSTQSGETFTVPCDTKKVFQISFNSQVYNISTADWIGGKLDTGNCKSNIIGRQTFGEQQWLVGDVFLKNVYSVFDFDKGRVGLGVKGGNGNGETATSATASSTAVASTGASTPASQSSPTGTANPSAAAEGSPSASQAAAKGGAGRSSAWTPAFALSMTLYLLSPFI